MVTADEFLLHQYHLRPDVLVDVLRKQAAILGRTFQEHLVVLAKHAPAIAALLTI